MKQKDGHKLNTLDDLQAELLALRKEQFTMRIKKATGALDKTHVIRQMRRAIARVKTMMTEKAGDRNGK